MLKIAKRAWLIANNNTCSKRCELNISLLTNNVPIRLLSALVLVFGINNIFFSRCGSKRFSKKEKGGYHIEHKVFTTVSLFFFSFVMLLRFITFLSSFTLNLKGRGCNTNNPPLDPPMFVAPTRIRTQSTDQHSTLKQFNWLLGTVDMECILDIKNAL